MVYQEALRRPCTIEPFQYGVNCEFNGVGMDMRFVLATSRYTNEYNFIEMDTLLTKCVEKLRHKQEWLVAQKHVPWEATNRLLHCTVIMLSKEGIEVRILLEATTDYFNVAARIRERSHKLTRCDE
jgi:hypothetical protein